MGQAIIRLGELKVERFVEGLVNNYLVFSPLPLSKQHSSGLDGDIVMSATPTLEIIDADLDVAINPQYEYVYSVGTDNKLKVAFDKSKHTNKGSAIDALKCVSVIYEQGELIVSGNEYVLTVHNSRGEEIHRTVPQSPAQLLTVMSTFDDTRQVDEVGPLDYKIRRNYTVK